MTRPRQKPPTIRVGGQARAMTGNARDGYMLKVDDRFYAHVRHKESRTIWDVTAGGGTIIGGSISGIHEQQAANAISRWFERRARLWLGADGGRKARS